MKRQDLIRAAVKRGKYSPLFNYLLAIPADEWPTTFVGIEKILGFDLPNSARIYRPWWANDKTSGHSQSMAWMTAGWKTTDVNLDAEQLTFVKVIAIEDDAMMPVSKRGERNCAPKMDDFRTALRAGLLEARSSGLESVIVRAGDLHRSVGGYPTPFNRMPMCCNAMYDIQRSGDRCLQKPKNNYGASLTIEYRLPR